MMHPLGSGCMLAVAIFALSVAPADARWHYRHHQHYFDLRNYRTLDLSNQRNDPGDRKADPRGAPSFNAAPSFKGAPAFNAAPSFKPDVRRDSEARPSRQNAAAVVPSDWKLQPPDQNQKGKRYVSADGQAWFASYASPAQQESVSAHMKSVAFGDDEEVTYLHGEHNRILVMGRKGDRVFYRQAILACGGSSWHHIAFEYPESSKRDMDAFIERAVAAMENSEDEGCGSGLYSNQ